MWQSCFAKPKELVRRPSNLLVGKGAFGDAIDVGGLWRIEDTAQQDIERTRKRPPLTFKHKTSIAEEGFVEAGGLSVWACAAKSVSLPHGGARLLSTVETVVTWG